MGVRKRVDIWPIFLLWNVFKKTTKQNNFRRSDKQKDKRCCFGGSRNWIFSATPKKFYKTIQTWNGFSCSPLDDRFSAENGWKLSSKKWSIIFWGGVRKNTIFFPRNRPITATKMAQTLSKSSPGKIIKLFWPFLKQFFNENGNDIWPFFLLRNTPNRAQKKTNNRREWYQKTESEVKENIVGIRRKRPARTVNKKNVKQIASKNKNVEGNKNWRVNCAWGQEREKLYFGSKRCQYVAYFSAPKRVQRDK